MYPNRTFALSGAVKSAKGIHSGTLRKSSACIGILKWYSPEKLEVSSGYTFSLWEADQSAIRRRFSLEAKSSSHSPGKGIERSTKHTNRHERKRLERYPCPRGIGSAPHVASSVFVLFVSFVDSPSGSQVAAQTAVVISSASISSPELRWNWRSYSRR